MTIWHTIRVHEYITTNKNRYCNDLLGLADCTKKKDNVFLVKFQKKSR